MSFAPQLITEQEARSRQTAETLVVREKRGVGSYFILFVLALLGWGGLTLPLWRRFVPELPAGLPDYVGVGLGFFLLLFWNIFRLDLKAARQKQSWQLASIRGKLYLNFRSYHHWFWPAEDKTVLELDSFDMDNIQPREGMIVTRTRKLESSYDIGSKQADIRMRRKAQTERKCQFLITLREKLPQSTADAIAYENKRMLGKGRRRGRHAHRPVEVGADGQSLLLHFGSIHPSFYSLIEQLRQQGYSLKAIQDISEGSLFSSQRPELSLRRLQEIDELARSGDVIGAIQMLREYTSYSLKDARDILQQGAVKALGDKIPR